MTAEQDLLYQRQATEDLIREAGRPVALIRPPEAVSDGAGGMQAGPGEPAELPAVDRYFSAVVDVPVNESDSTGQRTRVLFVLIGLWTDDIRRGDYFVINNETYIIDYIYPDTTYQIKATGELQDDGI